MSIGQIIQFLHQIYQKGEKSSRGKETNQSTKNESCQAVDVITHIEKIYIQRERANYVFGCNNYIVEMFLEILKYYWMK